MGSPWNVDKGPSLGMMGHCLGWFLPPWTALFFSTTDNFLPPLPPPTPTMDFTPLFPTTTTTLDLHDLFNTTPMVDTTPTLPAPATSTTRRKDLLAVPVSTTTAEVKVIVVKKNDKSALDRHYNFPEELLCMETIPFNAYLKSSPLSAEQRTALKDARRRRKCRGYADDARKRNGHSPTPHDHQMKARTLSVQERSAKALLVQKTLLAQIIALHTEGALLDHLLY